MKEHFFQQIKSVSPNMLNCLPAESRDHVKLLLSITPELRPDAFQTSKVILLSKHKIKF